MVYLAAVKLKHTEMTVRVKIDVREVTVSMCPFLCVQPPLPTMMFIMKLTTLIGFTVKKWPFFEKPLNVQFWSLNRT